MEEANYTPFFWLFLICGTYQSHKIKVLCTWIEYNSEYKLILIISFHPPPPKDKEGAMIQSLNLSKIGKDVYKEDIKMVLDVFGEKMKVILVFCPMSSICY